MKFSVVLFFIFFTGHLVKSQSIDYIDFNNTKAVIADNGIFFKDQANNKAGYEYPANSNSFTCYSMSFWMGGLDAGNQIHLAAHLYGIGQDMFAGPITDNYTSTYYNDNFLSSIWTVNKSQIDNHIANYTSTGYIVPPEIANWPGNGNIAEGVAAQLAPYVDINNDQVYNPFDGDYPFIQGDKAVYTIMNDAAAVHTESGGEVLGVEIHTMFYQFASTDDVNNTTFMNVKIYNRSTTDYHDFYFGLKTDPDIGSAQNDYTGCDSIRNLGYGYNGEANDNGAAGQTAYGTSPPAFGTLFLNKNMSSYISSGAFAGVQGDPSTAAEYYNYLKGFWKDGSAVINGSGANTKFRFSGVPTNSGTWTEVSDANAPGDRRYNATFEVETLSALSSTCYDVAFIVNNNDSDNLENVNNLITTADFIQNFYANNILPCNSYVASTEEIELPTSISIYPNPSEGIINIVSTESFNYKIYDLNGKIVANGYSQSNNATLNLDLDQGIYIIEMNHSSFTHREKIEILK